MKNIFNSFKDLLSYIVLVVVGLLVVLGVVFGIVKKTQGSLVAHAWDYDYTVDLISGVSLYETLLDVYGETYVERKLCFAQWPYENKQEVGYYLNVTSPETVHFDFHFDMYLAVLRLKEGKEEIGFVTNNRASFQNPVIVQNTVPRMFFNEPMFVDDFGALYQNGLYASGLPKYGFLNTYFSNFLSQGFGIYTNRIEYGEPAIINWFNMRAVGFKIVFYDFYGINYSINTADYNFNDYFFDIIGFNKSPNLGADAMLWDVLAGQGGGSYTVGYQDGLGAGYENGYTDGFDDGYADGAVNGYPDGYDDGYADGTTDGYEQGFAEGQSGGSSWLVGLLDGVSAVLNIQFLPGITFATVVFVPIVFALFWWLIKLLRGGE